ncbi:MAG: peroxiredoxin [Flavobacteriales bacterium]|jgi:peroxiredoxin Q/BCP|nr:peroxiredoxin [Flavobacteriales bacterium]
MLTIGTKAPDITVMDHTGKPFSLSDAWHHHSVVLFFYPKADTPICTKEACAFRDALADLEARDAMVIGVSTDDVAGQRAFSERYKLPFVLLCDTEGKLSDAYKVRSFFGLLGGRVTYVIDKQGVIRAAYSARLEADGHVQQALRALETDQRNS